MSIENEVVPVKQAINFSTDPLLIPSRLVMTLNSYKSIRLGLCEQVEILVSNAKGLQVKLKDDITVSLTSDNLLGKFYSDDRCITQYTSSNSLILRRGENEKKLYYKTMKINAANDSIGANRVLFTGVKLASPVVQVVTQLRINNPPLETNVGICSTGFTVTALDGLGQAFRIHSSLNSAISIPTLNLANTIFYSKSDCTNVITNLAIPGGQTTTPFVYFKNSNSAITGTGSEGSLTTRFTGSTEENFSSVNLATEVVKVVHKATALQFNSLPTTLNVGACREFTVSAIDGLNNVFSEGDKSVALEAPSPAVGEYYRGLNCTGLSTTTVTVTISQASPTSSPIYFKVTSASTTPVVLRGRAGLISGSASISITHTATALQFNPLSMNLNVGVCSGAFTVSAIDGLESVFNEISKIVTLGQSPSLSPPIGAYYLDNKCEGGIITSINVPASSVSLTSVPIYFRVTSVSATSVTLNGTFTGLTTASATVAISHLVLDGTFGSFGKTIPNPAGEILALEKYGDGYLIAGYTKDLTSVNRAYLALLNASGVVTSSFIDLSNGSSSQINSILVDGSDIYVGGFADMGGTLFLDYYISKFSLVSGGLSLNAVFNGTGTVTRDSQGSDSVIGLALNNSNLVVIGNRFEVELFSSVNGAYGSNILPVLLGPIAYKAVKNSSGNNIIIAGEANGKMAALSVNLNAPPPSPPNPSEFNPGSANSIALQGNNIFLMGTSEGKLTVLKLTSSLVLVSTLVSELLQNTVMTQANDIILDSAGNILIVGTTSNQMALRRYQPNGLFSNPTINSTTISFSPSSSVANRIILDGFKIVLGGNVGTGMGMARLHP